ncbi:alpha/beta fold family hydrolase [Penicillium atrosanguineum]|uniref:Alpha/beta fold family hydrolase n=1 Tax=Penicillium atrosanguineum TaxID=1132637 RepID=A0A9W9GGK6_9EURO|nr:transporter [Penicillium atrosanguineum]KAJ5119054.1 alpha/beta fold family hydrolase [Penicillium atrosanguineum]KAJ5120093.1 alpha/beta fold family hydrolase [Penicillium atrosanguineum]KAJ5297091.1 transporter [Penicillium atrosanguineum]KAJ5299850.1 alpha/beta fold family hydrolase [Penicillium atrosanguineum]
MEEWTFNTKPDTKICAYITRGKRKGTELSSEAKALLIFLHYWGGSSSTWHKLTSPGSRHCVSEDYPTITFDLRGWGKSTGPVKDYEANYSVTKMAQDVIFTLGELSKDTENNKLLQHGIILIGHSMGAKVALATLAESMDGWLLPRIRGLILIAPAPPSPVDLPPEMKAQQQAAYESEDSVRETINYVLAKPANLTESDIDMIVRDSLAGNSFAKKAWPSYAMKEDISGLVQRAMESAPWKARVIVGEEDVVEPMDRVQSEVVSFLENTGIHVTTTVAKGAKHLLPLEAPEIIAQEIRLF